MTKREFISYSESDTRELGRKLGENVESGICVLLSGDLGAGKTVLVRGVGEALGISGVRSPSFTLINEYDVNPKLPYLTSPKLGEEAKEGSAPLREESKEVAYVKNDVRNMLIVHADLYRLDDASSLGLEEYEDSVLFVEWPDRWRNPPVNNVLKVNISAINETSRAIDIFATGEKAERVLAKL